MTSNEAWFAPTAAEAANTTLSDTEIISYGAGWYTALSFAREEGFVPDGSHPVFIRAPTRPSKFPLLTFENVRSFNRGFHMFEHTINKVCHEATLKGDKDHKCERSICGDSITKEERKAYEDIIGKIRGLEDQIEELHKQWDKVLLDIKARTEAEKPADTVATK